MTRNVAGAIAIALFVTASIAHAQDRKGSSDHPLISRYPGSSIIGYQQNEFDEYRVVTGSTPAQRRPRPVFETFAGKTTTVIYRVTGGQSVLQVFRNYEQALRQAGLEVKVNCVNDACPADIPVSLYRGTSREALYRTMKYDGIHGGNGEVRYLSAVGTRSGAQIAVNLLVNRFGQGDRTEVGLDVIEVQAMRSGLVTVTPESLQRDISDQGKAVLDGIFFDTDRDALKTESDAALNAIAQYLQKNPSMRFLVVGHTDMVGNYDHNLDLSSRRAAAVIGALAKSHSVDRSRLKSVGIGPASPVAGNASEDGRARNRRVELVAMLR